MDPTVTVTDSPSPEARAVISDGLDAFNRDKAPTWDGTPLAVLIEDPETGGVVGGLTGRTSLGVAFIDLVFIRRLLLLAVLAALAGTALTRVATTSGAASYRVDKVSRVASPDGRMAAVTTNETCVHGFGGGSDTYEVDVGPAQGPGPGRADQVLLISRARPVVAWEGGSRVVVEIPSLGQVHASRATVPGAPASFRISPGLCEAEFQASLQDWKVKVRAGPAGRGPGVVGWDIEEVAAPRLDASRTFEARAIGNAENGGC